MKVEVSRFRVLGSGVSDLGLSVKGVGVRSLRFFSRIRSIPFRA